MEVKDLTKLCEGSFLAELAEVMIVEPNSEWDGNEDAFLGIMNELEQRVYSLSNQYSRAGELIRTQVKFDHMDRQRKMELALQYKILKETGTALKELMWVLLRWRLREVGGGCMGIREGFRVVECREQHANIPEHIKGIIGHLLIGGPPEDD